MIYNLKLLGSLGFVVTLPVQVTFEHFRRIFDLFILIMVYSYPYLKNFGFSLVVRFWFKLFIVYFRVYRLCSTVSLNYCDHDSRSKVLNDLILSYFIKYISRFIYAVQSVRDRFLPIYYHRTKCP